MSLSAKHLFGLICLMLVACAVISQGCIKKVENEPSSATVADSTDTAEPMDSLVLTLIGAEAKTVLDVLKDNHLVEMKSSAMGVFVVAIDSVGGGNGACWLYSVNGDMGQVACDRFLTRPDDTIRWHYRIIDQ